MIEAAQRLVETIHNASHARRNTRRARLRITRRNTFGKSALALLGLLLLANAPTAMAAPATWTFCGEPTTIAGDPINYANLTVVSATARQCNLGSSIYKNYIPFSNATYSIVYVILQPNEPLPEKICMKTGRHLPDGYVVTRIAQNSASCAGIWKQYSVEAASSARLSSGSEVCSALSESDLPEDLVVARIDQDNQCDPRVSNSSEDAQRGLIAEHIETYTLDQMNATTEFMCSRFGLPRNYVATAINFESSSCKSSYAAHRYGYTLTDIDSIAEGVEIDICPVNNVAAIPPDFERVAEVQNNRCATGDRTWGTATRIRRKPADPVTGNPTNPTEPTPQVCKFGARPEGTAGSGTMPDVFSETGSPTSRDNIGNPDDSETIDAFGGSLQLRYVDLSIPGNGGLDINVVRTYSSATTALAQAAELARNLPPSPVGIGWDMHFGRLKYSSGSACSTNNNHTTVLNLPSGANGLFHATAPSVSGTGVLKTESNWALDCAAGYPIVYSPAGAKYHFNSSVLFNAEDGINIVYISRVENKFGNWLAYEYDTNTLQTIKQITAKDGRQLDFSYETSGGKLTLQKITAGDRTVQYALTPRTRQILTQQETVGFDLNTVTRPDGSKFSYAYYADQGDASRYEHHTCDPNRHVLKSVVTPFGQTSVYTYDAVDFYAWRNIFKVYYRVVKTKSTQDGRVWTYKFEPANQVSSNTFDKTTVTFPSNLKQEVHYHYGIGSLASGADRGSWRMGLGYKKEVQQRDGSVWKTLQTETYDWTRRRISDRPAIARGAPQSDEATFAPLLRKYAVTRDALTYSTTYGHDAFGNQTSKLESGTAGERASTTTYANNDTLDNRHIGLPKRQEMPNVNTGSTTTTAVTTWAYDTNYNLTTQTANGKSTSYTYTADGDIASRTSPNNNLSGIKTTYSEYKRGVAGKTVTPDGLTLRRVINNFGETTRQTESYSHPGEGAKSIATQFTYDKLGRQKTIVPPAGDTTTLTWTYTRPGLTKRTSRGNLRSTETFDAFGRLVQSNVDGVFTGYKFDALGRQTFLGYPSDTAGTGSGGMVTRYDALGRTIEVLHQGESTSSTTVYNSDRTYTVTDGSGKSSIMSYVAYGHPGSAWISRIRSPNGTTTYFTKNKLGHTLKIRQGQIGAGLSRTFNYTTGFDLASESHPETGTTTRTYYANGAIKTERVGSSGVTTYEYDRANRVTKKKYPGGKTTATTYVPNGQLWRLDHLGNARWEYRYDNNGNLTEEALRVNAAAAGQTKSYSLSYAYNDQDHLTSTTYPGGETVAYDPDARGRPTRVGSTATSYVASIDYWPNGAMREMTYGNGAVTRFAQDSRQRTDAVASEHNGQAITDLAYGFTPTNNVESIVNRLDSSQNKYMQYDAVNRLVDVRDVNNSVTHTYNYDLVGNVKQKTAFGATTRLTYNNQTNLLTQSEIPRGGGEICRPFPNNGKVPSGSTLPPCNRGLTEPSIETNPYRYDAYGNIVSDGRHTYSYDDASNLVAIEDLNVRYEYDGLGRRVSRRYAGTAEKDFFVYDTGGNLVFEDETSQHTQSTYIVLNGKTIAKKAVCDPTVDNDNDGISYCDERRLRMSDSNKNDALADPDGDGLSNVNELNSGTSMHNADSDGDAIPDGYEVEHSTNPLLSNAGADHDGDGFTLLAEYQRGTDPRVSNIVPTPPAPPPALPPVTPPVVVSPPTPPAPPVTVPTFPPITWPVFPPMTMPVFPPITMPVIPQAPLPATPPAPPTPPAAIPTPPRPQPGGGIPSMRNLPIKNSGRRSFN